MTNQKARSNFSIFQFLTRTKVSWQQHPVAGVITSLLLFEQAVYLGRLIYLRHGCKLSAGMSEACQKSLEQQMSLGPPMGVHNCSSWQKVEHFASTLAAGMGSPVQGPRYAPRDAWISHAASNDYAGM